jgi:hypothetical protein
MNLMEANAETLIGQAARVVCIKINTEFSWKLEVKSLLSGIEVDGKLILKWISRNCCMMV